MKRTVFMTILFAILLAGAGCGGDDDHFMYRPVDDAQYQRLIRQYDPMSGNPVPLKPTSNPNDAGWYRISSDGEILQKNAVPDAPEPVSSCKTFYQMLQQTLVDIEAGEKIYNDLIYDMMASFNGQNTIDYISKVGINPQGNSFICD
jgi:hypothetical protein